MTGSTTVWPRRAAAMVCLLALGAPPGPASAQSPAPVRPPAAPARPPATPARPAVASARPAAAPVHPPAAPVVALDSTTWQGLHWRSIGPYRGGRTVASAGVVGHPRTFYMGATGGGVWKTVDGGNTWRNVSDGFFNTGSVGAIAVSESDPNVVYVGMGEHPVRGVTTSHGDGVYRSTDAGKTWTHLGLDATRHISRIRIDPRDPDVAWIAAQGPVYMDSQDRGVFKTTDGGRTWRKVLYVDESTGPSDLSLDMNNPRVLYAAMWDHRRTPWAVRSGGPGSGLWKSTDGGETWKKLSKGLPDAMGKVAVDVSRADPERVYAMIEADSGGLYRSDDAGQSWRRLNGNRDLVARAWYYIKVFADPQDADGVYVLDASPYHSTDGGVTMQTVRIPHGDTHDLWISPSDSRVLELTDDGGATISYDRGKTWSTQNNQPTAQFYRVSVDDRFPYWVYGGQQDNSSVMIASRTMGSGIGWKDWDPGPGCESAYLAFDPKDPRYVYGGCYQGIIEELDTQTGLTRGVQAAPYLGLASIPKDVEYRFNWNAPIIVSHHDPRVIYHGANVLLKSTDRGHTWKAISPDLTRNDTTKQGPGGFPYTNEGAGGEVYNTIFALAESPRDAGVIWVGSDDGLVHVTRDGGSTWADVTPQGLGEAQINAIDVSPHTAGKAYVVATKYKFGDFRSYVYRTTDWGASWTSLGAAFPVGSWARVLREDPSRPGLLYAGTELGFYLSFDDGASWQRARSNLPVVPITDLVVHDGDVVAATQGRGFWILDDVSPLRQLAAGKATAAPALFEPGKAIRTGGFPGRNPDEGANPPAGAVVYYALPANVDGPVTLDVLDASGAVLRHYSTAAPDTVKMLSGSAAPERLPARAGLNRFVWDLRPEPLTPVPDVFINGDLSAGRVAPGEYGLRLAAVGDTSRARLTVAPDPRIQASPADYAAQQQVLRAVGDDVDAMHGAWIRADHVRKQLETLAGALKDRADHPELADSAQSLARRIADWQSTIIQSKQKTFQDVINFRNGLDAQYLYLKDQVDAVEPAPTEGVRQRLQELQSEWQRRAATLQDLLGTEVPALNARIRDAGVGPVIVPKGG